MPRPSGPGSCRPGCRSTRVRAVVVEKAQGAAEAVGGPSTTCVAAAGHGGGSAPHGFGRGGRSGGQVSRPYALDPPDSPTAVRSPWLSVQHHARAPTTVRSARPSTAMRRRRPASTPGRRLRRAARSVARELHAGRCGAAGAIRRRRAFARASPGGSGVDGSRPPGRAVLSTLPPGPSRRAEAGWAPSRGVRGDSPCSSAVGHRDAVGPFRGGPFRKATPLHPEWFKGWAGVAQELRILLF